VTPETTLPTPIDPTDLARGFTLVMVHGWPDTPRLWDAQVAAFEALHRCVRFALPVFEAGGERPARAPSLQDVVDALSRTIDAASADRPVVLLLHDWGCLFGYEFAMQQPHRVAAVIGVDIGDFSSPRFVQSLSWQAKAMIAGYQGLAGAGLVAGRSRSATA
jgi:pimeloyl-ACP methyl ester carboxylesterase